MSMFGEPRVVHGTVNNTLGVHGIGHNTQGCFIYLSFFHISPSSLTERSFSNPRIRYCAKNYTHSIHAIKGSQSQPLYLKTHINPFQFHKVSDNRAFQSLRLLWFYLSFVLQCRHIYRTLILGKHLIRASRFNQINHITWSIRIL